MNNQIETVPIFAVGASSPTVMALDTPQGRYLYNNPNGKNMELVVTVDSKTGQETFTEKQVPAPEGTPNLSVFDAPIYDLKRIIAMGLSTVNGRETYTFKTFDMLTPEELKDPRFGLSEAKQQTVKVEPQQPDKTKETKQ